MTRFLGLVLLLSPAPVLASPADLCDAAAEQAAAHLGGLRNLPGLKPGGTMRPGPGR